MYPNENLIRFVHNAFGKRLEKDRFKLGALDIGAGIGTNSVFLANSGFSTYALEGSVTATNRAISRFKEEQVDIPVACGDAVKLPYPDNFFDLVVDIASIQHNNRADIIRIINEVHRVLKPGGMFFGMMRAVNDYLFGNGIYLEKGTYRDVPGGDLENIGVIHFFDIAEIEILFKEGDIFKDLEINYLERTTSGLRDKITHWLVSCKK